MIAVFVSREQANQAIDTLRHAGYSYDQIRLVNRGANSFVENVKSLFTGQAMTTTDSADDWMKIGVPEQDAHQYQRDLDADRSIVLIKSVQSPDQALNLLHQSGAYDLAFRFKTAPPTLPSGAYPANAQPATNAPTAAQGTSYPTAAQDPSSPNAQPATYAPNAQPATYPPEVPAETRTPNMQSEPTHTTRP
jgi:hypothetical protein